MKRRYREEPEEEKEPPPVITYGRPSTSSWVAAGAVAFAFFMLGGFIKTYMQLEDLREESRREIDALHESLLRLESQLAPAERPRQAQPPAYRVQPLPPARRERQEYWRETPPEPVRGADVPSLRESPRPEVGARQQSRYDAPDDYRRFDDEPPPRFEEYRDGEEPARPRVQFGRRSSEESRQILSGAGTPCQVVSVSGVNKRIMIEGGRDAGMSEGLRLELIRDSRWIGDVRVLDVFDNQSSCEVLHATLEPLPGDTVRRSQR